MVDLLPLSQDNQTHPAEAILDIANAQYMDGRIESLELIQRADQDSRFKKKQHMTQIVAHTRQGGTITCALKYFGTETNFKGDAYEKEAEGYIYARQKGIPTPHLLFAGKSTSGHSIILTQFIDAPHLHDLIYSDDPGISEFGQTLNKGLQILANAHLKGMRHGDTDTVNILCPHLPIESIPVPGLLIDFAQCKVNCSSAVNLGELNTMATHLRERAFESYYERNRDAYQEQLRVVDEFIKNYESKGYKIERD